MLQNLVRQKEKNAMQARADLAREWESIITREIARQGEWDNERASGAVDVAVAKKGIKTRVKQLCCFCFFCCCCSCCCLRFLPSLLLIMICYRVIVVVVVVLPFARSFICLIVLQWPRPRFMQMCKNDFNCRERKREWERGKERERETDGVCIYVVASTLLLICIIRTNVCKLHLYLFLHLYLHVYLNLYLNLYLHVCFTLHSSSSSSRATALWVLLPSLLLPHVFFVYF